MKLTKGYTHLYRANIPATETKIEASADAPETPTFSDLDSTSPTPANEPKQSVIPKVVIIGLVVLIVFLIYKLIPRSYEDCSSLPGSQLSGTTCTTFFKRSFTKDATQTPTTNTTTITYPFPSTTPKATADSTYIPTTKGGIPLTTPMPSKSSAPKTVTTPSTPVPTSAPSSNTAVPSDWVKHLYPDQDIAFWLPKGWTGSTAVYHTDTGITNLYLGGPDSIKVTIMPNWNSVTEVKQQTPNYQVNDNIPAIKIVGSTYTAVYFERNGEVYQFTCQNSLWNTCHIILQNLEFI